MKRIRILREPRGGNYIMEFNTLKDPFTSITIEEETILEVPDEIAKLLCAPRCPECGAAYPHQVQDDYQICPACSLPRPEDPKNEGVRELVPSLAEMVKP